MGDQKVGKNQKEKTTEPQKRGGDETLTVKSREGWPSLGGRRPKVGREGEGNRDESARGSPGKGQEGPGGTGGALCSTDGHQTQSGGPKRRPGVISLFVCRRVGSGRSPR